MIEAAQLVSVFKADTSQADAGYDKMAKKTQQQQGFFEKLLGKIGGFAVAGAAFAGVNLGLQGMATLLQGTITATGNFQASLTSLTTGAGELASNLDLDRQSVLKLARDTGTSVTQLTTGLYNIESAGYHGAAGLDVLRAAAEGAKVGNADLNVVADATTTIMTDYASSNITAAQSVNTLISTVTLGKTTMTALSGALSTVLPTASAAKISLNDVMGAMAAMTSEGIPAAEAATYLRQTIVSLTAPGEQAKKTLESIGLKSADVAAAMQKSLPDALKMITDALSKKFKPGSAAYIEALKNISGGMDQMQGLLALTGDHLNTFQTDVQSIAGDVNGAGNNIKGWAAIQSNFNQKIDKAKEVIETLGIRIGSKLMPIAGQVADFFSSNLIPTFNHLVDAVKTVTGWVTTFANFLQQHQSAMIAFKSLLAATAIVIGIALVAAFIGWAVAAWNAAVATIAATWPILAIILVIAALIAIVWLLVANWGTIWKAISDFVGTAWGWITGHLSDMWNGLVKWVTKTLPDAITGAWQKMWKGLGDFVGGVWNGIIGFFKGGINGAIDLLNSFIRKLNSFGVDAGPLHIHLSIPTIPHLAKGGTLIRGGDVLVGDNGPEVLRLPRGAQVVPLSSSDRGSGNTYNINVTDGNIDENKLVAILKRQELLHR